MIEPHPIERPQDFLLAGNAHFTLRSKRSGQRFTYRIKKAEDKELFFVGLLSGPDNSRDYQYLGIIKEGVFRQTAKSRISPTAPSAQAIAWTLNRVLQGRETPDLEIWHEGRCGRCGRRLTVPESISSGFGPECIQWVGADQSPELEIVL